LDQQQYFGLRYLAFAYGFDIEAKDAAAKQSQVCPHGIGLRLVVHHQNGAE
jgi:hypothetical protein